MNQLTQREFLFLDDLLEAEHLAAMKARSASQSASDPQIRQLFEQLAGSHEQHFSGLLRYLNQADGANAQASGASWQQQNAWQNESPSWQSSGAGSQSDWQAHGGYHTSQFTPQNPTQPVQQRNNTFTQ